MEENKVYENNNGILFFSLEDAIEYLQNNK